MPYEPSADEIFDAAKPRKPAKPRYIIVHAKSWTPEILDAYCKAMKSGNPGATIITGRDDAIAFQKRTGGSMNWDAWSSRVGSGKSGDGVPFYDALIVPEITIGRGAADCIRKAFSAGKPVWYVGHENGIPLKEARRVRGLLAVDEENWKSGWTLTLTKETP